MYHQSALGSKIIPVFQGQYNSIDIRGIFVRKNIQDKWRCVFLKMFFTKQSINEIEEIHSKKKNLIETKNDNLIFLAECKNIYDSQKLLEEISDIHITIEGIKGTLHPFSQNILEKNVELIINDCIRDNYITSSQRRNYECGIVEIQSNSIPKDLLIDYKFNTKDPRYNNLFIDIDTFLDTTNINSSNRNGIILFPIYWKVIKPLAQEIPKYALKFEVNTSILNSCQIYISIMENDLKIDRINQNDLEESIVNDTTIFSIPINYVNNKQNTFLNIELFFKDIDTRLKKEISCEQLMSSNKIIENPLLFTFKYSKANSKMNDYIESKVNKLDKENQQVIGTTWLLSILGFSCINLGILANDDEKILYNGIEKGAADSIAFNNEGNILLIDFTTGIPKGDKIDRIRKTANFISQKTSLNAVPVIISNQDCNTIKKSLQDVIVIDINDINIILELISNNRLNEAKDVMSKMILV